MLNTKKDKLLILGAGGYGKSLAEVAELMGCWSEICFVDDQWPALRIKKTYSVISNIVGLSAIDTINCSAIAAIGNNQVRHKWHDMLLGLNIPLATIIHPQAVISPSAIVKPGASIMAGCVLGTDVLVEQGCILNSGVLLDHDVKIGQYAHLSLGVKVAGGKEVQPFSFLEIGRLIGNN